MSANDGLICGIRLDSSSGFGCRSDGFDVGFENDVEENGTYLDPAADEPNVSRRVET